MCDERYRLSSDAMTVVQGTLSRRCTFRRWSSVSRLGALVRREPHVAQKVLSYMDAEVYDSIEVYNFGAVDFSLVGWRSGIPYAVHRIPGEPSEDGYVLHKYFLSGARRPEGAGVRQYESLWKLLNSLFWLMTMFACAASISVAYNHAANIPLVRSVELLNGLVACVALFFTFYQDYGPYAVRVRTALNRYEAAIANRQSCSV